jgi:hypothetical protein
MLKKGTSYFNKIVTVGFEVFTAVPMMTMKNGVFWDMMPCDSCKIRRFGGQFRLHHQGEKNQRVRNNVSINYGIYFSEMSVLK